MSENANEPAEPISYQNILLDPGDHEPVLRSPRLPFVSIESDVFAINLSTPIDRTGWSWDHQMRIERQAALDWLLTLRAVDDHVYEQWVIDLQDYPEQLAILIEMVNHAEERINEIRDLIEEPDSETDGFGDL